MKAYYVDVYCDTIPNFPESIIEKMDCNWCSIIVPESILRKWYELHKKEIHEDILHELGKGHLIMDLDDPLDFYMCEVYTCDSTEDVYSFCMSQRYLPGILL